MAQRTTGPIRKHRLGTQSYLIDYRDELADGESLTGQPTITITKRATDGSWTDVTSEFGVVLATTPDGRHASFQLGAATGSQQDAGTEQVPVIYGLFCLHATDASPANNLPSMHVLVVSERGDPNAP